MNLLARHRKANSPLSDPLPDLPPVAAPRPPDQYGAPSPRSSPGLSIISAALTITGRLESAGDIQIDGKVEGDVRGEVVRIGSTAMIEGTVAGEIVELAGTLKGDIEASSAVLLKTAHMSGDIVHQLLKIDQGAHFNGSSHPHAKAAKMTRMVEVAPPVVMLTGTDA